MKDIKTLLLLLVSLLLIVVSVFLLYTWTYRVESVTATAQKKDSGKISAINTSVNNNAAVADSLQRFYNSVLGNINKSIDSVRNSTDSLNGGLSLKLTEFYKLRTEIGDLLKTKLSDDDIVVAKQKIIELQQRVTQLRIANTDIERENIRLNSLVAQLSAIQKSQATVSSQSPTQVDNKNVAQRTAAVTSTDVLTSDVKLNAIAEGDDNNEQETVWAQQTSKMVGSFVVKNNSPQTNMIEMVVVVLQPDGKVLQKSTWETGTFETKEGKKIYSYKTRADYNAGESRRMLFSLSSDRYMKGNYTMQIYNKGVLIARITRNLS